MSNKDEVRKASKRFYAALNRMAKGDVGPMADIWSQSKIVTTLHPIGGREVGWDAVRGSFEQVAQLASGGKIGLRNQLIEIVGALANEVGIEHGQIKLAGKQVAIEHRVTNIHQRQTGTWKLVHHHTDVSPGMLDVLKRLERKSRSQKPILS